LVAAFKATLQETQEADILLHVVDASDDRFRENIAAVDEVLLEIDAHEVPTLLVMNKIDSMEDQKPRIEFNDEGVPTRVWVSAMEGEGIDLLFDALTQRLASEMVSQSLCIPPSHQGKYRSLFIQMKCVQQESYDEQGNLRIDVRMQQADWARLTKREGAAFGDFIVID
jgi:GTP-binding protein HflX